MTKKKRFGVSQALTRGLSETINVVENNTGTYRNIILPLSRIELDPDNPRKLSIDLVDIRQGLDKEDVSYARKLLELEKLKELAGTIQASGLINPIIVYKKGEVYRIVAGERRSLASILAGRNEIDARVFNEKPNTFDLKLIQWIENTAREDLTLNERIENIRDITIAYLQNNPKETVTATLIKNVIGLSLPQATYYLNVLNAPDDVKAVIKSGELRSLDKAAIIATIKSNEMRKMAIEACLAGSSLKDLRKIITRERLELKNQLHKPQGGMPKLVSSSVISFPLRLPILETLVKAVVENPHFNKYVELFSSVDWSQKRQAVDAYKRLIAILENEIAR